MKVKEFKEWLSDKNDEDVVIFSEYSPYSEAFTRQVKVVPRVRSPKRTEFSHKDCKYCETLTIKNQERYYCNKAEDIIGKYNSDSSCEEFEHRTKQINYCLECRSCYAGYSNGCKSIYKK